MEAHTHTKRKEKKKQHKGDRNKINKRNLLQGIKWFTSVVLKGWSQN